MKNILIADSGATKTDWCLTKNGEIIYRFESKGISPVFQTQEEIAEKIKQKIYPILRDRNVGAIYFYGTGCIPEKIPFVRNALRQSFPLDTIEVYSDLIGSAHSLCGHEPGIACILGTGSNSCQWDGEQIVKQVSPLGFILGDEGSGANLGKLLIGDALKNQLTPGLKEKLLEQYGLTQATIIDKVYRQPFPSRSLASVAPFLLENIADSSIQSIVDRSFNSFFERNIMQYDYKSNKVNFIGSIAHYFAEHIKKSASNYGIEVGTIVKAPMEGLISYYAHY